MRKNKMQQINENRNEQTPTHIVYKAISCKIWDINCNSFFVNFTTNCGLLFNTMLFDNIYNFYMLSLNNLTNSFADILSVVVIKCVIFNNLSHTTKIVFFSTTNSNFIIKSTIIYVVATTHHSRTNDLTSSKALSRAIK